MTTAVVATLLGAAPERTTERDPGPLQKPDYGKAAAFQPHLKQIPDPTRAASARTRQQASREIDWPDATGTGVTVPAKPGATTRAASLPVSIAQPKAAAPSTSTRSARTTAVLKPVTPPAPAKAGIRILDRATTTKLGIEGVVLTVGRTDGRTDASALSVALDYSGFAYAYSGNWASRLRMLQLPACALTTPHKPACRITKPLPSTNDTKDQTVTAQVTTPKTSPTARSSAFTVLALSAGTSSDRGTYEATPLSPSATWAGGGSNGDFTWFYPMDTVPAPAGPTPSLSINYSAQSVDGRTSSTSAQPSWVGEGFDLPVSYIERSYGNCDDDGQDGKFDQCWKEDNASIVLNGKSSTLILKDAKTNTWRLQGDDGERVIRSTGATNGDDDGEHWTVTTTDGTQYVFGKNRLPGWASGKPETNSVWTVPVFGDDTGEPGYDAGTSFAARAKTQAWRWNLDYVIDPRGNVMTYWYTKETNYYAKNGSTGNGTAYNPAGYLTRIDYGQRTDTIFSTTQPAAARVKFTVAERCIPVSGGETCTNLSDTNRNAWPDVPYDQICKPNTTCTDQPSPSFFTRKRLTGITTQVYKGTGTGLDTDYRDVNHWTLTQDFPDPGDGSNPGLWLRSIQHTGKSGTPVTLPAITFSGIQLHNRVDKVGDDIPPFIKWRVRTVTSETGSVLTVNYSDPECLADTNIPSALDKNTKRCYPVKWIPPSNPTPGTDPQPRTDWFHKYVVTQVTESDPTGGAPLKQTDYTYHGAGAWAYDDQSPITPNKYRTWGTWRGYQKVTTTTGEATGTRSKTTSLFYRGMHGDKQLDGTTRTETVTDSQGTTVNDEEQYAGQTREQITYNGTAGEEVSATITAPWSQNTATSTHDYGTLRAYMVRTAKEVKRTPVAGGTPITSTTTTTYDPQSGQPLTVETEGGGQKDCTRAEYAKNTTAWLLTHTKRVERVSVGCDATPIRTSDPNTTHVISDVRTSYDGQAWGVAPTKGDVTATQRVIGYNDTGAQLQTVQTAQYDALGRLTDQWDTRGTRTNHIEYTPATGGPLTAKKEINALGHTITTEIAPDWGSNTVSTDPNGKRTENAYDALGRLTDVWLPDRNRATGQTPSQQFEYKVQRDLASWVATKSLKNDGTYQTSYVIYDALLRPRQTQAPAAAGEGRVVMETKYDTRGLEVETSADYIDTKAPSGQLDILLTASPAGTRTVHDGAGRPTVEITLVNEKEHSRTRTTYDGNATTVEPPAGASAIREVVDSRGRLAEKREYDGNQATGAYTRLTYTYGRADQLTKVQDTDGNAWAYQHDFLGRPTTTTDPDAGTSRTEYDDLDRINVTEDARGNILSYTYDVLGRPTGRLSGRIPVVNGVATIDESKYLARWSYDTIALGQPTSAIRYEGGKSGKVYAITNAAYDPLYRVLREQYTISTSEGAVAGTGTYTITNAYNLDGTLQKRVIPAMGGLAQEILTYGYNDQRLPTTLQGLTGMVRGTDYLPAGERIRITLGVSSTAKWTQINTSYETGTKRLARQTVVSETNSGTDADTYYRYDPAGNPIEIDDRSTAAGDKQCFTYDGHRRLKGAWTSTTDCTTAPASATVGGIAPYWTTYTYDSAGNRKTATDHLAAGGPTTTTYAYDHTTGDKLRPHLLASTATSPQSAAKPATSYTYDASGNTTTRVTGDKRQTLQWGPENDLTKVIEADNSETSFLNDANGNRLIRRDTTGTTLYLGETELRYDRTTGKVEATRYYTHGGQVVAIRTPQSLTWLSSDHNGTANVQIDAATQTVTRRRMQPFGEDRGAQPTSWTGERGFAGGTKDTTGLTHLGARDYDPITGRFVSADPIADLKDPQQINGYAYSNNNPVTFADPDGKWLAAMIKIIKAVVRYIAAAKHPSYRQNSASRASRNGSRTGLSASGSASYTSGGANCHPVQRNYGLCGNQEPEDPRPLGQAVKDSAGAFGEFIVSGLDAIEYATEPWCWFGADCGATDTYREKVKDVGVDVDSEDYQKTLKGAEYASWATGLWGMGRALAKKLAKGGAGKKTTTPDCKCFLAGTDVLMADGSTKDIEDIELGDMVQATDPETGKSGPREVTRLIVTEDDKHFNEISIVTPEGVEQIIATHEHPFWSPSLGDWIEARELRSGVTLLTDDGDTVVVSENRAFSHQARTYNLTVDDLHTYYVLAGDTPVLVHNSNCPALTKTDRIAEHLTLRDLDAAKRELAGEVVARKSDGTPWDHVAEVRDAQNGLLKRMHQIKVQISKVGVDDPSFPGLQAELSQASKLLDYSEKYVPRH